MNMLAKKVIKGPLLALFFTVMLASWSCYGHDWQVHRAITESAYRSSSGLQVFLDENLENPNSQPLTTEQLQCPSTLVAIQWLKEGSTMEDELLYSTSAGPKTLRCLDHFYTVTPARTPGQVIGITDGSEGPFEYKDTGTGIPALGNDINNSFVWATQDGIQGPSLAWGLVGKVGMNTYKWDDARAYEFAALISANQTDRDANIANTLYVLGHILHLNQDLSQPDHTRNDNHNYEPRAYIENYGKDHFQQNPQWFVPPPHDQQGWAYWQSQGFSQLLDFWDTGNYVHSSSVNLDQEADGHIKLGLAEFSNGNFLGERALYKEVYKSWDKHYFPFPSKSSTDFPGSPVTITLASGQTKTHNIVKKKKDGITGFRLSVLNYFGAKFPSVPTSHNTTLNDDDVLQDYHSILIPKAVEYSTGILDYFFRGTIDVTATFEANSDQYTFVVQNTSSQDFGIGSFFLVEEDTNNVRTIVQTNSFSTVPTDTSIDITYPGPAPQGTKFLVVYQGTVGVDSDGNAFDPVDTNICIAVGSPLKQTITYTYQPSLASLGLTNGSTIVSNLASEDFYFTPTHGNYQVTINRAYFDDNGSIGCDTDGVGGISAPLATDCGWPHDPIISTVVPPEDVTIVGNHLQVNITATDNGCGVQIGWVDVSITWRAWPAP